MQRLRLVWRYSLLELSFGMIYIYIYIAIPRAKPDSANCTGTFRSKDIRPMSISLRLECVEIIHTYSYNMASFEWTHVHWCLMHKNQLRGSSMTCTLPQVSISVDVWLNFKYDTNPTWAKPQTKYLVYWQDWNTLAETSPQSYVYIFILSWSYTVINPFHLCELW